MKLDEEETVDEKAVMKGKEYSVYVSFCVYICVLVCMCVCQCLNVCLCTPMCAYVYVYDCV